MSRKPMSKKGEGLSFLFGTVIPHNGDDCLVWPFGRSGAGYGMVYYDGRKRLVHRVVCDIKHGPPPTPSHEAAHSCGRGHDGCCNPNHVAWKTHRENVADQLIHGTRNRGERQGLSKITEHDVQEIRKSNDSLRVIAARFGIAISNASLIKNGKSWEWLK